MARSLTPPATAGSPSCSPWAWARCATGPLFMQRFMAAAHGRCWGWREAQLAWEFKFVAIYASSVQLTGRGWVQGTMWPSRTHSRQRAHTFYAQCHSLQVVCGGQEGFARIAITPYIHRHALAMHLYTPSLHATSFSGCPWLGHGRCPYAGRCTPLGRFGNASMVTLFYHTLSLSGDPWLG